MATNNIKYLLSLRDARAAENAAARKRCQSDMGLVEMLRADAKRRGLKEINWPEYFRNIDINYP